MDVLWNKLRHFLTCIDYFVGKEYSVSVVFSKQWGNKIACFRDNEIKWYYGGFKW